MPSLDERTDGAQGGDFIVLAARPSVGKTFFMLNTALQAWRNGSKVLFVTMEMLAMQCMIRVAALNSGIPHSRIKTGRLSDFAVAELQRHVEIFRETDTFRFLEAELVGSVEDVVLKIQEYQPDVVFVDGAYLLRNSDSLARWDRVMTVAEELKKCAMRQQIPVFASYQQGRAAVSRSGSGNESVRGSLGTIGYSDAPGQLATIALDMKDDETEAALPFMDEAIRHKIISIIKNRDGTGGDILLLFNMQRMLIQEERVL
jgi:replicative DNA helicase